jgi:chromosome partitioning protein
MAAKLASIINMKGGVGKTTLTFNLASYLAEIYHKKVLLIDLDPQANATIVSIEPDRYQAHCKSKKTIADVFIHAFRTYGPIKQETQSPLVIEDFIYSVFQDKSGGQFDLVPSELMLSSVLKGMTLGPFDLNHLVTDGVRNQYDYILVDCAPTNSSLTTVALNTTGAVLIPMIADSFGAYGTELMRQVLEEHKYDFGIEPKVIGVVFMLWDGQQNQVTQSNEIIKKWPHGTVFRSKITENKWYRIANGRRDAVWNTPAHKSVEAELKSLVDEFVSKV